MDYRYYRVHQPILSGDYPKRECIQEICKFNRKKFCKEIEREAWGYIVYNQLLPEQLAEDYELKLMGIKTWYCITSSYNKKGKAIAAITEVREAIDKPDSTYTSTRQCDIYCNWYDNIEDARNHMERITDNSYC